MNLNNESLRLPPGPKGFFETYNHIKLLKKDLLEFYHKITDYGEIARFRFGNRVAYIITNPEHIRHVLVENNQNYTKSVLYKEVKHVVGNGLLTSEGDFWRRQRKLAQPSFHKQKIIGFAEMMVSENDKMLQEWESGKNPFDVSQEMMKLTFSVVGKTLFGSDISSFSDRVGESLYAGIEGAANRMKSIIKFPLSVPTPANIRFNRAISEMDKIVYSIIAEKKKNPPGGADLLSMLIDARDEETGEGMNELQLKDEIVTFMLAGHETTSTTLTWAFYLLSKYPEVAKKIRSEVIDVLGDRNPSLEDVSKLKYTTMVIEETMRLYPAIWVIQRNSIGWDEFGGYKIPPGTIVSMPQYIVHRDPLYWENPEGFDPERFSEERSKNRPKYSYFPFGGGPRTCIGNIFAMMEATIILSMAVRKFRLDLVPGFKVEKQALLTLRPKFGMMMHRVDQ
ncbi:MAG: cytochrome P450 [Leptospira sp.]|nr:cytochrome P450 [Leptospira sp.]